MLMDVSFPVALALAVRPPDSSPVRSSSCTTELTDPSCSAPSGAESVLQAAVMEQVAGQAHRAVPVPPFGARWTD
jgi:hypothetical protein